MLEPEAGQSNEVCVGEKPRQEDLINTGAPEGLMEQTANPMASAKKKILFVDDEPNILEGLQRILRGLRHEWDMYFALSGPQALAMMADVPIEFIITDMRMPQMNGAELLAEVMRLHPNVVRIVLSGQADQRLTMQCFGVTHQYLTKPCDAESIKAVILRAAKLRTLLQNETVKHLVSQIGSLPSIPSLHLELLTELRSAQASIERIGRIISRDPAMTAKVLQLANSALFRRLQPVSNAVEAVSYIGLERIYNLFLSETFSDFRPHQGVNPSVDRFWQHSLMTANLAKTIVQLELGDARVMDEAFTAGLLHDIGALMLSSKVEVRHGEATALARAENLPMWEAELKILGASHAEVGAYLLGLWDLPDPVVEAIAYHHRPGDLPATGFCPLTAVHAANALVQDRIPQGGGDRIDMAYLESVGLKHRLPDWRRRAADASLAR